MMHTSLWQMGTKQPLSLYWPLKMISGYQSLCLVSMMQFLRAAADAALSVSRNQKKKQSTTPAILGGIVKGLKGGKMVHSGDSAVTPKSTLDHLEGVFSKSKQLDLLGLDHQENLELNIDDIEIDEPLCVISTSLSHDAGDKKREGDSERDRLFQGGTGDTKPRFRTETQQAH